MCTAERANYVAHDERAKNICASYCATGGAGLSMNMMSSKIMIVYLKKSPFQSFEPKISNFASLAPAAFVP